MSQKARVWSQPRWVLYKKHRPAENESWRKLVQTTRLGEAYYRQEIDESEQRELEMDCVMNGPFIREIRHKRMFYMDIGRIMGASAGEETRFLYAEWLTTGEVHGRPITVRELRNKGALI